MQDESTFKVCPGCGRIWPTRASFLADANLELNGYQADFGLLEDGLFCITHTLPHCLSTLAITAREFTDLCTAPRFEERRSNTDECPRLCFDPKELSRCPAHCECAFVRELLNIVRERLDEARQEKSPSGPEDRSCYFSE